MLGVGMPKNTHMPTLGFHPFKQYENQPLSAVRLTRKAAVMPPALETSESKQVRFHIP